MVHNGSFVFDYTEWLTSNQNLLASRAIRDNDEEVDGRELHKYSWHQMLDEPKYLLDKCLDSTVTFK